MFYKSALDATYEIMLFKQPNFLYPSKTPEEIKKKPLDDFLNDQNLEKPPVAKVKFPLTDKNDNQGDDGLKVIFSYIILKCLFMLLIFM